MVKNYKKNERSDASLQGDHRAMIMVPSRSRLSPLGGYPEPVFNHYIRNFFAAGM